VFLEKFIKKSLHFFNAGNKNDLIKFTKRISYALVLKEQTERF
jgi:hypothetical protein